MKLFLSIFLILYYSCFQEFLINYKVDNDKGTQFIDDLGNKGYILASNNYIYLETGEYNYKTTEWIEYLVFIKDEEKEVISQVDITDGIISDKLLIYKNVITEKKIILWKQEDEYWSYFHFYLFENGQIMKISDVGVGQYCDVCDSFNYPQEKIAITSFQNKIKIEFLENSVFFGSEYSDIPYHSVKIKTEGLKIIYDGLKSNITY